jgi:hypothetical protein
VVGIGIELTDEAAQDSIKSVADMIMLNEARGAERRHEGPRVAVHQQPRTRPTLSATQPSTWRSGASPRRQFKALNPVGAAHGVRRLERVDPRPRGEHAGVRRVRSTRTRCIVDGKS